MILWPQAINDEVYADGYCPSLCLYFKQELLSRVWAPPALTMGLEAAAFQDELSTRAQINFGFFDEDGVAYEFTRLSTGYVGSLEIMQLLLLVLAEDPRIVRTDEQLLPHVQKIIDVWIHDIRITPPTTKSADVYTNVQTREPEKPVLPMAKRSIDDNTAISASNGTETNIPYT
ncbi:uncharacterized protein TEOVI_000009200 [Trypanosoma equiperdum]|uniref:Uncharacterized protein n=2 Tax=Trypanozoon TaxID=39700 RepID=Q38DA5_TRYB2|nr:hypothetical protein Tb09.211.4030 [Trypanosoma brucei brucei TREU927]EAN77215.1 hypothetical protein Tb09.211.4030 [Trypanosoma brucei brucei TREU927]SCU64360.1 hypothetical protein, conserved [Trypanosoma equiperdum]